MENNKNGSKKNLPVVRQAFHGKKKTPQIIAATNVPVKVTNTV